MQIETVSIEKINPAIYNPRKDLKPGDLHPTMKPVEMITNRVMISSHPSGIVLDLFGGSGSTLIACEKLGRRCYMLEISEHYCDVIITRWQNFTGKTAELINGN